VLGRSHAGAVGWVFKWGKSGMEAEVGGRRRYVKVNRKDRWQSKRISISQITSTVGLVTGHDFSRAATKVQDNKGFRPCQPLYIPVADCRPMPRAGAKQTAEKLGVVGENDEKSPSAAKAGIDSEGFMRGLNPPPPSDVSLSAVCKAPRAFFAYVRHD